MKKNWLKLVINLWRSPKCHSQECAGPKAQMGEIQMKNLSHFSKVQHKNTFGISFWFGNSKHFPTTYHLPAENLNLNCTKSWKISSLYLLGCTTTQHSNIRNEEIFLIDRKMCTHFCSRNDLQLQFHSHSSLESYAEVECEGRRKKNNFTINFHVQQ